jgi:hypothetical protein
LREKSEEELAQLLRTLPLASATCADLFDLAKLILSKRELEERIRKLPASEIENLRNGKASAALRTALLAESKVFPEAQEVVTLLMPLPKPKMNVSSTSLSAYETLLAVTEIIFATEQHWLETTKTGLKSLDAKLIAEKFKWQPSELQLRFRLALRSGLVCEQSGRWMAGANAQQWLKKSRTEAWQELAQSCWDLPKLSLSDEPLTGQLLVAFPLIDLTKLSLLEFGPALGLINLDHPRPPLAAGSFQAVTRSIALEMPKVETKLVVQGDLSIVCPGPIDPELHRKLDSFADSEDLGLASRYRLTALSVSHHLECGGKTQEIEDTLVGASKSELPQPVRYLLADTQQRYGSLKVLSGPPAQLVCSDAILLTQILNEKALVHLALKKTSDHLTSPAAQELCYFSLRDCGYVAVMAQPTGRIISPRFTGKLAPAKESNSLARAKNLLSGEQASAELGDIQRQLRFALRNKLQVTLSLELDGQLQHMLLTPLGLAGNRLRGRDEAKQAERTLPLSRIRSVVLS